MRLRTKAVSRLSAVLCLLLLCATAASAQTVTTGNIAGTVTDTQGGVLPGATVTAVHTPTGTNYEAITGADGRFSLLNVRVGPYTVSVTMSNFCTDEPRMKIGRCAAQRLTCARSSRRVSLRSAASWEKSHREG